MNASDTNTNISKAYRSSRLSTIIFAILVPVATAVSAMIITLCEGDWWFNLFLFNLAGIGMIVGTLYLSFLTLMCEITQRIGNKVKARACDTPFVRWIHRLLLGIAVAGIITFFLLLLIFFDILNGGLAILHFICAVVIGILYLILGINIMVCRKRIL